MNTAGAVHARRVGEEAVEAFLSSTPSPFFSQYPITATSTTVEAVQQRSAAFCLLHYSVDCCSYLYHALMPPKYLRNALRFALFLVVLSGLCFAALFSLSNSSSSCCHQRWGIFTGVVESDGAVGGRSAERTAATPGTPAARRQPPYTSPLLFLSSALTYLPSCLSCLVGRCDSKQKTKKKKDDGEERETMRRNDAFNTPPPISDYKEFIFTTTRPQRKMRRSSMNQCRGRSLKVNHSSSYPYHSSKSSPSEYPSSSPPAADENWDAKSAHFLPKVLKSLPDCPIVLMRKSFTAAPNTQNKAQGKISRFLSQDDDEDEDRVKGRSSSSSSVSDFTIFATGGRKIHLIQGGGLAASQRGGRDGASATLSLRFGPRSPVGAASRTNTGHDIPFPSESDGLFPSPSSSSIIAIERGINVFRRDNEEYADRKSAARAEICRGKVESMNSNNTSTNNLKEKKVLPFCSPAIDPHFAWFSILCPLASDVADAVEAYFSAHEVKTRTGTSCGVFRGEDQNYCCDYDRGGGLNDDDDDEQQKRWYRQRPLYSFDCSFVASTRRTQVPPIIPQTRSSSSSDEEDLPQGGEERSEDLDERRRGGFPDGVDVTVMASMPKEYSHMFQMSVWSASVSGSGEKEKQEEKELEKRKKASSDSGLGAAISVQVATMKRGQPVEEQREQVEEEESLQMLMGERTASGNGVSNISAANGPRLDSDQCLPQARREHGKVSSAGSTSKKGSCAHSHPKSTNNSNEFKQQPACNLKQKTRCRRQEPTCDGEDKAEKRRRRKQSHPLAAPTEARRAFPPPPPSVRAIREESGVGIVSFEELIEVFFSSSSSSVSRSASISTFAAAFNQTSSSQTAGESDTPPNGMPPTAQELNTVCNSTVHGSNNKISNSTSLHSAVDVLPPPREGTAGGEAVLKSSFPSKRSRLNGGHQRRTRGGSNSNKQNNHKSNENNINGNQHIHMMTAPFFIIKGCEKLTDECVQNQYFTFTRGYKMLLAGNVKQREEMNSSSAHRGGDSESTEVVVLSRLVAQRTGVGFTGWHGMVGESRKQGHSILELDEPGGVMDTSASSCYSTNRHTSNMNRYQKGKASPFDRNDPAMPSREVKRESLLARSCTLFSSCTRFFRSSLASPLWNGVQSAVSTGSKSMVMSNDAATFSTSSSTHLPSSSPSPAAASTSAPSLPPSSTTSIAPPSSPSIFYEFAGSLHSTVGSLFHAVAEDIENMRRTSVFSSVQPKGTSGGGGDYDQNGHEHEDYQVADKRTKENAKGSSEEKIQIQGRREKSARQQEALKEGLLLLATNQNTEQYKLHLNWLYASGHGARSSRLWYVGVTALGAPLGATMTKTQDARLGKIRQTPALHGDNEEDEEGDADTMTNTTTAGHMYSHCYPTIDLVVVVEPSQFHRGRLARFVFSVLLGVASAGVLVLVKIGGLVVKARRVRALGYTVLEPTHDELISEVTTELRDKLCERPIKTIRRKVKRVLAAALRSIGLITSSSPSNTPLSHRSDVTMSGIDDEERPSQQEGEPSVTGTPLTPLPPTTASSRCSLLSPLSSTLQQAAETTDLSSFIDLSSLDQSTVSEMIMESAASPLSLRSSAAWSRPSSSSPSSELQTDLNPTMTRKQTGANGNGVSRNTLPLLLPRATEIPDEIETNSRRTTRSTKSTRGGPLLSYAISDYLSTLLASSASSSLSSDANSNSMSSSIGSSLSLFSYPQSPTPAASASIAAPLALPQQEATRGDTVNRPSSTTSVDGSCSARVEGVHFEVRRNEDDTRLCSTRRCEREARRRETLLRRIEQQATRPFCRICQVSRPVADLISPCRCAGTSRHVHSVCLAKWRAATTNPEHKVRCSECKALYIDSCPNVTDCAHGSNTFWRNSVGNEIVPDRRVGEERGGFAADDEDDDSDEHGSMRWTSTFACFSYMLSMLGFDRVRVNTINTTRNLLASPSFRSNSAAHTVHVAFLSSPLGPDTAGRQDHVYSRVLSPRDGRITAAYSFRSSGRVVRAASTHGNAVGRVNALSIAPFSGFDSVRERENEMSGAVNTTTPQDLPTAVTMAILASTLTSLLRSALFLLTRFALILGLFFALGFVVKAVAFVVTGFDPDIDWSCQTYLFYHIFVGGLAFFSILMNFCNGLGFVIDYPCTLSQRAPLLVLLGILVPVLLGYAFQFWSAIIFDTVPTGEVSFGAGFFSFVAFVNNILPKLAEILSPEDDQEFFPDVGDPNPNAEFRAGSHRHYHLFQQIERRDRRRLE